MGLPYSKGPSYLTSIYTMGLPYSKGPSYLTSTYTMELPYKYTVKHLTFRDLIFTILVGARFKLQ